LLRYDRTLITKSDKIFVTTEILLEEKNRFAALRNNHSFYLSTSKNRRYNYESCKRKIVTKAKISQISSNVGEGEGVMLIEIKEYQSPPLKVFLSSNKSVSLEQEYDFFLKECFTGECKEGEGVYYVVRFNISTTPSAIS
jgi:hypothetical protein